MFPEFFSSGKQDQIVSIEAPATSIAACQKYGLKLNPMELRITRVELNSGEPEILIISLLDYERYPTDLFAGLYPDRWPVEEDYNVVKYQIELENFSGKSVLSVYQDSHARMFSKNTHKPEYKNNNHNCQSCSNKTSKHFDSSYYLDKKQYS